MQESDDPIKYLPLPEEFEPSAEKAAAAIYGTVSEPSPTPRFDLPDDCLPVVEAKKLYQKAGKILTHSSRSNIPRCRVRKVFLCRRET
ncbi:hypothetical protein BDFG_02518 [Blastomyces dermatitidis ATCC 26199]|nr:hypothetical protein BDFG_02518 [Blastomyces dermatitidis ATCC 26199]